MALVEIRDVRKRFGELEVLKGVSLDVETGQVVCLLGSSGSGKTTLLRCINNLETIDAGSIRVDGERIVTPAHRASIGMVFQRFNLFPHLTALGNVCEAPIHVRREPPQRAREQRVAIARALAMRPKLMLFDEPTSALDPELVGEVLQVMRDLASKGMTMIAVTHEMAFARDVADRVCMMDGGAIVEDAPPAQFFTAPSHPRSQAFLTRVRSHP